jgi:hypothetical protein
VVAQQKKDWLVINEQMKGIKRDIIILRKESFPNKQSLEKEVMLLNDMLQAIEKSDKMSASFELIDLNRFKVISKSHVVTSAIRSAISKPFEFLINKN